MERLYNCCMVVHLFHPTYDEGDSYAYMLTATLKFGQVRSCFVNSWHNACLPCYKSLSFVVALLLRLSGGVILLPSSSFIQLWIQVQWAIASVLCAREGMATDAPIPLGKWEEYNVVKLEKVDGQRTQTGGGVWNRVSRTQVRYSAKAVLC